GKIMRIRVALAFIALLLMIMGPAAAIGMSSGSGCVARNALEAYCVNHGGCPKDGNCYFPDGGYCDLESFYRGTCPGKEYYEDALWMLEAYAFLYGDFTPYGQYYVPGTGYSYYANPYANQLSNPYWNSDLGSSYYWPVYAQGYGTGYGTDYGAGYGTGYGPAYGKGYSTS
ncbi:MAG TPA: hypothetical protein PKG62_03820, partial [Methanothrix soehngenii]|nr:hypothetical protein [Methanothrix soehngenii]